MSRIAVIPGDGIGTEVIEAARTVLDALLRCAADHYLLLRQGYTQSVMMAYSDLLGPLVEWFCQLWGESLGKAHDRSGARVETGLTPIKALGVVDQHSQIQLYAEGPRDKFVTFLEVADFGVDAWAVPERIGIRVDREDARILGVRVPEPRPGCVAQSSHQLIPPAAGPTHCSLQLQCRLHVLAARTNPHCGGGGIARRGRPPQGSRGVARGHLVVGPRGLAKLLKDRTRLDEVFPHQTRPADGSDRVRPPGRLRVTRSPSSRHRAR